MLIYRGAGPIDFERVECPKCGEKFRRSLVTVPNLSPTLTSSEIIL